MASFTVPCPKTLTRFGFVSNNLSRNATPNTSLSFGFQEPEIKLSIIRKVQAKLNKVIASSSSNSVAAPSAQPIIETPEKKDKTQKDIIEDDNSNNNNVPDVESITAFMAQVSDLVKLVDSRDIVELQMKQWDCEVTIRKKEALEQPAPQQVQQYAAFPSHAMYASPPSPPPPQQAVSPVLPAPSSAPPKPAKSSHPPLKCPMAGTFYRSPAPGEPPFVKVGDKIQKGQVVCIIEAMKLMNEIEADQSGTLVEIVAEDGKPVSVDTPLFVIAP